jgi:hypothetical protein
MLDRISSPAPTDTTTNTENLTPPAPPETQSVDVFESISRRTELAFQASLTRFSVLGNSASTLPAQAPPPPASTIRQDVVDNIVESFEMTPTISWQDRLLYVLRDDKDLNLTHDEQMAVVSGLTDHILDQDYADELLNITFLNFDANEVRNVPYDNQRFLAGLIGDAYQAGQISDSDLHQIAEKLGEEGTEALALNLASNANNVRNNYGSDSVVEALGKQAESLGYDTAAALAFTSSESLILEHYPTAQSQRDAFAQVRDYIERYDEGWERSGFYTDQTGESATVRSNFTQALLNASRLTANGNGYSQGEFDDLLKEVGPDLVNETIARATNVTADDYFGNALDALGDASQRIAQNSSGDDQKKWQLNADIAYTQSSALIRNNLTTPEARLATFDRLNQQLVDLRDDVEDSRGDDNVAGKQRPRNPQQQTQYRTRL